MKCPNCPDTTLVMSDRQGVEIDYCPACRGIWLDRGELDKLLERAAANLAPPPSPSLRHRERPDFDDSGYRPAQGHYKARKKSWLDEIFD